jgi:predicted metal-dependent hydrolase
MATKKILSLLHPMYVPPEAVGAHVKLQREGWRFYVTDQRRGFCKYHEKTITIPAWVFKHKEGINYIYWYVAHEIAHAVCTDRKDSSSHGPEFMKTLKTLCSPESAQYEVTYQPKMAVAHGLCSFDF